MAKRDFFLMGECFKKQLRKRPTTGKTVESRYDGYGSLQSKEIIYQDKTGKVTESWRPSKIDINQLELSSKTVTTEIKGQLWETYNCIKEKDPVCGHLEVFDKSTKLRLRVEYGATVLKYDYEFDSNGNWTQKTELQQVKKFGKTYFEPNQIIAREINYY